MDASNVLNMTSLGNPDNTAESGTFGKISDALRAATVAAGPEVLVLAQVSGRSDSFQQRTANLIGADIAPMR